MRAGIIGLEYSGRKTLFSLLTGIDVASIKPGKEIFGAVNVPDPRVDCLADLCGSKKKRYSQFEFNLLPPVKKDSEDTRRTLAEARFADMFVVVVRSFTDSSVFHPLERVDPSADYELLRDELILGDLYIAENRLERVEKLLNSKKDDDLAAEREALKRAIALLEEGKMLHGLEFTPGVAKTIKGYQFLTLKPIFVVVNCDEDALGKQIDLGKGIHSIPISLKIEAEIGQLEGSERAEYLDSLGLETPATERLIRFCYRHAGLISYLTTGPDETRAWTIHEGETAPEAAGAIHSDFEKGFIRADVVRFDDFKAAGSEKEARAQNLFRLEGKDYVVRDGDVVDFRFNL